MEIEIHVLEGIKSTAWIQACPKPLPAGGGPHWLTPAGTYPWVTRTLFLFPHSVRSVNAGRKLTPFGRLNFDPLVTC